MEETNKLVSIIIPNYNRAHLITETLDSIKAQDYPDWECIIIDDHSTDDSILVIQRYIAVDERFSLIKRPDNRPKGACACRNYGFELSKGHYVQWFDSDDLMLSDHVSNLVEAIEENNVDFAVGDTLNFTAENNFTGKPYEFNRESAVIDARNYGKQAIGWITDDFLGKRKILKNLEFNEKFQTDGDEYNFFTRLLHENRNGIFVNRILTFRRIHEQTLSRNNENSQLNFYKKISTIKYLTFLDIEKYGDKELLCWFLSGYMQYSFKIGLSKEIPPFFDRSFFKIRKYFSSYKAFSFIISVTSAKYAGRGYMFLKKAIQY